MIRATIPILTPEQIHRGWYNGPGGTHCLMGWCDRLPRDQCTLMWRTMHRLLPTKYRYVGDFNDAEPASNVAELWNSARAVLK